FGDFDAARANAARRWRRPVHAVQTARQNARHRRFARSALSGKNVTVSDAFLRDRILDGGPGMLLPNKLREILGTVFSGNDLVHGGAPDGNARPRVIRGTHAKPLPLLPSGPGGVCGRALHEARSLTNTHANMRALHCSGVDLARLCVEILQCESPRRPRHLPSDEPLAGTTPLRQILTTHRKSKCAR